MRRLFWLALGASVGVLVVRKVTRTAKAYTPEGVAQGLAGVGEGLREMASVVKESMAQRDAELRLALGVDEGAINPETAQQLIERPSAELRDGEVPTGLRPNVAPGGRAR
ncbi:MAG TPA: hypothetical protein VFL94_10625 [Actinomycetales bacterium]|nr:hypothetical protein [Actinomycetales bacterium]